MSLTKSLDVWCDWPDCSEWTHGVVATAQWSGPAARLARAQARSNGWRRVQDPETAKWRDLCPTHAERARQRRDW